MRALALLALLGAGVLPSQAQAQHLEFSGMALGLGANGVGLAGRVVETCEGQVCYLRCSGTQRLTGSLTASGTVTANNFVASMAGPGVGLSMKAGVSIDLGSDLGGRTLVWSTGVGSFYFSHKVGANAAFQSDVASGNNGFNCSVNGCRIDFGAGASDYATSDGTTVAYAGPLSTQSAFNAGGLISSSNANSLAFQATGAGGIWANGSMWMRATAPTISSGFGTSPSVAANNGTAAFTINVGTGGTANSGVVGLPAATTGWRCSCDDITTQTATVYLTKQTATSTTSCTVGNFDAAGAAAAWVASNILVCSAMAY